MAEHKLAPEFTDVFKSHPAFLEFLPSAKSENLNADISALLAQVDDSHYSLADWVDALLKFDGWLSGQKIGARPLASMIGYTHCCTLTSAETLAPPSLEKLVEENLNQFGFEVGTEVKTD